MDSGQDQQQHRSQTLQHQQQKRAAQNEVERQRREVLNVGFARLATVVPTLQCQVAKKTSSTVAVSAVSSLGPRSESTITPTTLPASKQTILAESYQYILSLQTQLNEMSRALAAADSKCFSLVAELHRMSHASGLTPNLDDIQGVPVTDAVSDSLLSPVHAPMSPVSEQSEGVSPGQTSRKRPSSDELPNETKRREAIPTNFSQPIVSTIQSSTSVPTPSVTPTGRMIMKSGRPKGSLNKKTASNGEQAIEDAHVSGATTSFPQLLVRVPSAINH
ncbi:hypothetical protein BDR26DRAFT_856378 [Obelidium mucronatum]|nr:hypothetical protein BDR26DRAFT_856378 [Obelidium mucronatum]